MDTNVTQIKAWAIKTNAGCFITDYPNRMSYDLTRIENLLFDGKKPRSSFSHDWFILDQFPSKVQRIVRGRTKNVQWEIIDKDMASKKLPEIIPYGDENFADGDGEFVYPRLYTLKQETLPDTYEDVTIEWESVLEVEDFKQPPEIKFNGIYKRGWSDAPYVVDNKCVKHQGLDKIIFPEILLHERPSSFDSDTVYNITRQYVIDHIDPRVAKITSNYDFCFSVCKIVPKNEPETIIYHDVFARTKREREKIRTSVKKFDEYKIFEMTNASKRYQGYTPIPAMFAETEDALNKKMKTWLEGLMEEINKPLCQCPQCNGTGFLSKPDVVRPNYT